MDRSEPYALASPRRFAAAVASVVNEITRKSPAPRELPFFALDHPPGVATRLLDRLCELGIFRFYERVLDVGRGLGGPARWLARRRGCVVVSFDRDRERALANYFLVRRAHLESAIRVGVAAFERLPVPNASFTHAWSVESLHAEADKGQVAVEIFRAVRPGGHVALQEWVTAGRGDAAIPGFYHEPAERYLAALGAAGFVDARVVRVQDLREVPSAVGEIARERAAEMLGEVRPEERERLLGATATLVARERAIAEGRLELVQLFAKRPA